MARYDFASDNAAPATPKHGGRRRGQHRLCSGYGTDAVTARAADLVRELLDADAEVRFVGSGTAANAISLTALCRPFEAVLAHEHAHICTDEAGAPGFFGQGLGLIPLPGASGRIEPVALDRALAGPEVSYRQPPAALSLTNATEYGAVYSAAALGALRRRRQGPGAGVHLDGARLANAAAAGFDLKTIKSLGVDMLVVGGTKSGMPPTEAVAIFDRAAARRFDVRLKQPANSRPRRVSWPRRFIGMLEDGAFLRHATHANAMATRLAGRSPFPVLHPVETNGVFVEMDEPTLARLHAAGWFAYRFPRRLRALHVLLGDDARGGGQPLRDLRTIR